MSETNDKGVPFAGDVAMRRGWGHRDNPHPKGSPDALQWAADWDSENAACFASHCENRAVKSWKARAQDAEAELGREKKATLMAIAEIRLVRAKLKDLGHAHEGAPLDHLVADAIAAERSRIEDIRKAVAALEKHAAEVYPLPALTDDAQYAFRPEPNASARRHTFEVPEGFVAIRDSEGRATGDIAPIGSTEADGWVEWHGGECPLHPDALVEVRFAYKRANGTHLQAKSPAGDLKWGSGMLGGDIIAYRLVK